MSKKCKYMVAIFILTLIACSSQPGVEFGDRVKIEYRIMLADGTVIDSTQVGHSMEIEVGTGTVFPAIESALIGMAQGEAKDLTLMPEEAYGQRTDMLIGNIPRRQFSDSAIIEVGQTLQKETPDGFIYAEIIEVTEDSIRLDANHPLAGESLIYNIRVVEINKP